MTCQNNLLDSCLSRRQCQFAPLKPAKRLLLSAQRKLGGAKFPCVPLSDVCRFLGPHSRVGVSAPAGNANDAMARGSFAALRPQIGLESVWSLVEASQWPVKWMRSRREETKRISLSLPIKISLVSSAPLS